MRVNLVMLLGFGMSVLCTYGSNLDRFHNACIFNLFFWESYSIGKSFTDFRKSFYTFARQAKFVMKKGKILVIGAGGQVGTELVQELRLKYGTEKVVATDIKEPIDESLKNGPFEILDVLDKNRLLNIIQRHEISVIYQLAAMLSATAEKYPNMAWNLNMTGLFNVLDLAKEGHVKKVFWPSSIAIFGPSTPKTMTPQVTITEPSTVYGISKIAGERWCEYYFQNYGVDVRSIRYPGLIGYKSLPGGGTTDYAVDIFHKALAGDNYECFLSGDTKLPMMYMEDAIRASIEITEAPLEQIKVRSSYNVGAMSFTPDELADKIKEKVPNFEIIYKEDFRQEIADSWPNSIDDHVSRAHWGWREKYGLDELVEVMFKGLSEKFSMKLPS